MKSPRLVIAATGSGKGKTTFVSALLIILKKLNMDVHAFKCGPDYIDPGYHERALGVESKNLDPYFCDVNMLRSSYIEDSGEINIIEGCMGLYDGLGVSSQCSTYSVASALEAPVILIVDGYGMGYSIVPQLMGFLQLDSDKLIKGVIINRISSSYYGKIAPVIEQECKVKVLGYIPKMENTFESRHLGLKSVDENGGYEILNKIANNIKATIDLEGIVSVATQGADISGEPLKAVVDLSGVTVAVAKDEAFSFCYKDNLRALKKANARIVFFSPIHDKVLPEEATALYLPGGYPENYLRELQDNESMRQSIRDFIEGDGPCVAECGGYMYLNRQIDGSEMVGIFDDAAFNTKKSVRFGYIHIANDRYSLKGHEFHHYDVADPGSDFDIKRASTGEAYKGIHVYKKCIAGFPHFYFYSDINFLEVFR